MPNTSTSCIGSLNPCENCINRILRRKVHAQWARQSFHILENNPNFIQTVHNIRTGDFLVGPMAEYSNEVHRRSHDIVSGPCNPRNSVRGVGGLFSPRDYSRACSFDTPLAPKLVFCGPNSLESSAESTSCFSGGVRSRLIKVPDRTRQHAPSPLGVESTVNTMPADLATEILYCIRTYEPAALIGVGLTLEHVAEARCVLSLQNGPDSERKEYLEELHERTTELTKLPAPTLTPLTDSRETDSSRWRTWPKELVRHCSAVGCRMKGLSRFSYMMLTRSKLKVDGPYYVSRGCEEGRDV